MTCNNEKLGVCTRYFSPKDFENLMVATSALAGFQSTFLRTLRCGEHEIVLEIK